LGVFDGIGERIRNLNLNTSLSGTTLVVVGAVVLAAAVGAGVFVLTSDGQDAPKPQATLTCVKCQHQWDADLTDAPQCPSCGNPAGIIAISYRCENCQHVFHGNDVKMIGPGDYRYRVVGSEQWIGYPPQRISCPKCRRLLRDVDAATVRGDTRSRPDSNEEDDPERRSP